MTNYRRRRAMKRIYVSSGMSFGGWLTLLFIALKLTGFISWPWLWVLSPLWIGALFVALVLVVFLIILFLFALIENGSK